MGPRAHTQQANTHRTTTFPFMGNERAWIHHTSDCNRCNRYWSSGRLLADGVSGRAAIRDQCARQCQDW